MARHALRFTTRDGLTLRGAAWGEATAPPVLFLHGGGQTHYAWDESAERLAAHGWHAVALDQRGHGDSDRAPDGDYRMGRFADDLLDVAAALPRPPVVIGASLGGLSMLIAQARAHARAQARPFAACVLVDITPRMRAEGVAEVLSFMAADLEHGFDSLEAAADAVARYLPQRPRPRSLDGLARNLRRGADGRWRWHWDPRFVQGPLCLPASMDEASFSAAARLFDEPVLLVRGRLSNLVTEAEAAHFQELVPHARVVDVSGAGHMVAGDRNDRFTQAIVDFLAGLPAVPDPAAPVSA